jgi:beta-N-acetylhexosaminidase
VDAVARSAAERDVPLVTVALRTPWDLAAYPAARTHACTFSILPESMDALAGALFGRPQPGDVAASGATEATGFPGRLPVAIAGIAERGHGLTAHPAGQPRRATPVPA